LNKEITLAADSDRRDLTLHTLLSDHECLRASRMLERWPKRARITSYSAWNEVYFERSALLKS